MCARKHTVNYFSGWMIDGLVNGWISGWVDGCRLFCVSSQIMVPSSLYANETNINRISGINVFMLSFTTLGWLNLCSSSSSSHSIMSLIEAHMSDCEWFPPHSRCTATKHELTIVSVCVSRLLKMVSLWEWGNLISRHHLGLSLTGIDALCVDSFLHPSPPVSILLHIMYMFILLARILNCDRNRSTEFSQWLNMEARLPTTVYLGLCLHPTFGLLALFIYLTVKQIRMGGVLTPLALLILPWPLNLRRIPSSDRPRNDEG